MSKKFLSLTLAFIMALGLFTFNVSAAKVGDSLGDVLYSDITAYINGSAIPASIKNGTTMVVVEDLANYGFDIVWNGKDKTLKVELNTGKKVTPLAVEKNNKPVGTFKCKYVYTDIKTYLSGQLVESFAIDGRTLIDFELLSKYGKLNWNGATREIRLTTDASGGGTSAAKPQSTQAGKLTNDIFKKMESGAYHIKISVLVDEMDTVADIYAKNGMSATVMDVMGMKIRSVYKDGKSYMIMDAFKMISVTEASPSDDISIITDESELIYVGEGSGDFKGKTYKYDEYKFEDDIKMFYFVDGGNLKGIRIIDTNGEITEMEILAFDQTIPDSVFDIPSDYEITEY